MFTPIQIGIDLGTANILVYTKHKGMIINEPSVVAININTREVLAVGAEAKRMVGKTPKNIVAIRPLKNGVIADYQVTTEMLKYVMKKTAKQLGRSFRKPHVVISTPSGATSVERRAIKDAVKQSGAKDVELLEEPIAAAIGADLPVGEPTANVIVDIGGGTTEVGIISLGGIVSFNSIRVGGDQLDDDIGQFIRKKYQLLIGTKTAETVKMKIGYALVDHDEQVTNVRGRDIVSGLPKTYEISSYEMQEAIKESLLSILEVIQTSLETCPPELSGDIVDQGVVLSGGGALLNGIEEWLSSEIVVPVHIAPSPLESVAIGTGRSLIMRQNFKRSI